MQNVFVTLTKLEHTQCPHTHSLWFVSQHLFIVFFHIQNIHVFIYKQI